MARKKMEAKKEAFVIHSLSLTKVEEDILERLSGEASDYTGRKVSGSAVMRALLRFADQQGYPWVLANLCPLIEAEVSSGVVWGKKK